MTTKRVNYFHMVWKQREIISLFVLFSKCFWENEVKEVKKVRCKQEPHMKY